MLTFWDVRSGSRLFDELAGVDARRAFRRSVTSPWSMAKGPFFDVTVTADKGQTRVTADVPGYRTEDLDVTINAERHLTIKGTNPERGDFEKVWLLPEDADQESLTATLKDGVLTVTVGKLPKAEPRKVPILGQPPSSPELRS